ncbi:hypothetical protein IQ266_03650 [filamentous cyanobacterium LEGE 11480]|uniref:Carrier domain-containing protein n=1 Tax=Romeriopsis navalis LEGE 11480 TaxID=2777977 RepID=A0A928VLT0_9CYAN|nr:condensation domain-containing protein [Romeriopsis navalis]MBE9028855.1 hypothetical protein [Romeriopsis navalis LEGE 11480]
MDKQNIETIYSLAPLQQMFLWHSLQSTTQAGLIHIRCDIHGELEISQFQQAWECVIHHHPSLRTSVHWENVKQPLQVVAKQVALPWKVIDGRNFTDPAQTITNFLHDDRAQGFDLNQAPITRLTLFRLGAIDYKLVWSCHHLMLDGWSGALVLNQVFATYEALQVGHPPTSIAAPTYQTYIRWLKQQDETAAAQFWRDTLKGFTGPTPLPPPTSNQVRQIASGPISIRLTPNTTEALQAFLRVQRLTLSTVIQGVWSLLLHHYSGENDVLFGMTVSGRQGDLAQVEAIVGLLINVLPIRVSITPAAPIADWLRTLQTQQIHINRYAYASSTQIQAWSGQSKPLFDSLLVIENYPIQSTDTAPSLRVENLQSGIVSTYGLTLIVQPGNALKLTLEEAAGCWATTTLELLLDQFQALLQAVISNSEQPLTALLNLTPTGITRPYLQQPERSSQYFHQLNAVPPNDVAMTRAGQSPTDTQANYVAPQNTLESQLTTIWETVLGVQPIGVHDNFFSLGGNSLMAVSLFNQIESVFQTQLPLVSLFQASTVAELAKKLAAQPQFVPGASSSPHQHPINRSQSSAADTAEHGDQPPEKSHPIVQPKSDSTSIANSTSPTRTLIALQPKGDRRPFFFIPGGGGGSDRELITYNRFLNALGDDQPVYGLRARGLDGTQACHADLETMATDYIQEMRTVQPHGPYLLGGECIGGIVAYEIAQQLTAQGEPIGLLALMDTEPLTLLQERRYYIQKLLLIERGMGYIKKLSHLSPQEKVRQIAVRSREKLIAKVQSKSQVPISKADQQLRKVSQNYWAVISRYRPQPYSGKLTLLATAEATENLQIDRWETLATGGVEVHALPGDHTSYIREDFQTTADALRQCLDAAQTITTHSQNI